MSTGLPQCGQAIFKVLVPLALPSVFNSIRLLFGLAFGYIMLAEIVTTSDSAGGIGSIGGSSRPDRDFPHFVRMFKEGELDLNTLVTTRYPLERINDAVGALERGEIAGRAILEL